MRNAGVACAVAALVMLAGCGPAAMVKSEKSRAELADALVKNPEAAAAVVRRLVESDTTRAIVAEQMMANSQARQEFMMKAARERTMIEGMLNVAVQDSAMKTHVMTLMRGMQMMDGR